MLALTSGTTSGPARGAGRPTRGLAWRWAAACSLRRALCAAIGSHRHARSRRAPLGSNTQACGDAEGGYTDVAQARALMQSARPPISARSEQDDRIRWATLTALTLLQNNRRRLDELAELFKTAPDVGTCIRNIES